MASHELAATDRYVRSRTLFRHGARKEFFSNENAARLVQSINDYVARVMFASSGEDISGLRQAEYIGGLLVSFTRTHFIVVDLVVCSELIESATLLRKQFELIARLQELNVAKVVTDLLERTPNLRALKTDVRRLYGEYSRIAHSAHHQPLQLLGRVELDGADYTALYPTFDQNAYIALNHVTACVLEYYSWAHAFCSQHFSTYDAAWGEEWRKQVIGIHESFFASLGQG